MSLQDRRTPERFDRVHCNLAAKAGARGKVNDYWMFSSFGIGDTRESASIVGRFSKDAG
jgi:hypothetical protein